MRARSCRFVGRDGTAQREGRERGGRGQPDRDQQDRDGGDPGRARPAVSSHGPVELRDRVLSGRVPAIPVHREPVARSVWISSERAVEPTGPIVRPSIVPSGPIRNVSGGPVTP